MGNCENESSVEETESVRVETRLDGVSVGTIAILGGC